LKVTSAKFQCTHLTITEFHLSYGISTWLSPSLASNLASTLPHLPLPHQPKGMAKGDIKETENPSLPHVQKA
jgi:hypothetical protein